MKKTIALISVLLLALTISGCDSNKDTIVDNNKVGTSITEVTKEYDVKDFLGEYYYKIDDNNLILNIAEEDDQIVYFLSYYPGNSNKASEEIKGTWNVKNFNTKDSNVMYTSLANYDISNITLLEDGISLSINLTDYITEDYKDYVIPSDNYKFSKRKFIEVDGHKMNYGTYRCEENGNTLILREDGTYIKKYQGFSDEEKGTFAVENYDMSQDNSNDMHECIVVRKEGGHGGYIARDDYSLKDGEWFIYYFSSYEQE